MRSHLLFTCLASGALGGFLNKRDCAADNCARAVTGTRFAPSVQAQHTADCSSFMIETITPATPTTYTTITPTVYSPIGGTLTPRAVPEPAHVVAARQVTQNPSAVPLYASACAGTSRYSSACSCAGITETTTYAPTPATQTSTVYAPASTIPVCDPNDNYGLLYDGGEMDPAAGRNTTIEGTQDAPTCCAMCYEEESGCLAWYISGGQCYIVAETTGDNTPTDYCPTGIYALTGSSYYDGGYGLGPCLYAD